MAYKIDDSHEVKNFVRRNLWRGRTTPLKHFLTLTSPTCGDIVDGINRGLITPETRITIFEKEPSFVDKIRSKLHSLGLYNFAIFNCQIEKNAWRVWFEQNVHGEYDLIYLDFCGNMTYKIWDFLIDENVSKILKATTVAFTFSLQIRNNALFNDLELFNDSGIFNENEFDKVFEPCGGISLDSMKSLTWVASQTVYSVYDAIEKGTTNPDSLILYREDGSRHNMLFMRMGGSRFDTEKSNCWRNEKGATFNGLLGLTLSELHTKYKGEKNPAKKAWISRAINLKT